MTTRVLCSTPGCYHEAGYNSDTCFTCSRPLPHLHCGSRVMIMPSGTLGIVTEHAEVTRTVVVVVETGDLVALDRSQVVEIDEGGDL